jgi:hypothetical protein
MCSVPVTLGGGSRMQKLSALLRRCQQRNNSGFPLGVPAAFDIGGLKGFGEFHGLLGKGETRNYTERCPGFAAASVAQCGCCDHFLFGQKVAQG